MRLGEFATQKIMEFVVRNADAKLVYAYFQGSKKGWYIVYKCYGDTVELSSETDQWPEDVYEMFIEMSNGQSHVGFIADVRAQADKLLKQAGALITEAEELFKKKVVQE